LREPPTTTYQKNKKNKNQKISMKCKITKKLRELRETNKPKNKNSKKIYERQNNCCTAPTVEDYNCCKAADGR